MRQLLPEARDEADPYEVYRPGRDPVVRANMVTSADGAVTALDGRSGVLGGPGDREVFRILRAHADAIVVGAGTARTEGYGPHRLREDLARRRAADGRAHPAAMVVVSARLDLDFTAPLFTAAVTPTVVLTCGSAPADRRRAAERAAVLVVAGADRVDLSAGLAVLRGQGHRSLLCEGGPVLLTAMLAAGLVDELCLTLAPCMVGAAAPRLLGQLDALVELSLQGALSDGGELFLRYAVAAG